MVMINPPPPPLERGSKGHRNPTEENHSTLGLSSPIFVTFPSPVLSFSILLLGYQVPLVFLSSRAAGRNARCQKLEPGGWEPRKWPILRARRETPQFSAHWRKDKSSLVEPTPKTQWDREPYRNNSFHQLRSLYKDKAEKRLALQRLATLHGKPSSPSIDTGSQVLPN